jgi:hypothetical protein
MDISKLREKLTQACKYVEGHGGKIVPGSFGTDNLRRSGKWEVCPGNCYCPIGALELFLKQDRMNLPFEYDPFVDGFDSEIESSLAWAEKGYGELYDLGREFRKQYVKGAARP